jgi:uncharacterized protein (DUF488 family)
VNLYTIGHSNHPIARFLDLLAAHGIEAVADVRTVPASARHPQYNRAALTAALAARGIEYWFLGTELGARRAEPEAYDEEGIATYERITQLPAFREGLDRVKEIAVGRRVALMCAEREPLDCHRTLLVCRHLRDAIPGGIRHILGDGSIETHQALEQRLVRKATASVAQPDLFAAETEALDAACRRRGLAIAYRRKPAGAGSL